MQDDNYLLISLKDEQSKKLAQVISNETSRKILDLLTKKDATETEIAETLQIPLSTVHYNMKALTQSGLVKVDEFHYSEKGKEVNHYSLANKVIVIAPAGEDKWKQTLRSFLPIGMFGLAATFVVYLWQQFKYASFGAGSPLVYSDRAMAPISQKIVEAPVTETIVAETNAVAAATDTIVEKGAAAVQHVAEAGASVADQAANAVAETSKAVVQNVTNMTSTPPPGAFPSGRDALTYTPHEPNIWVWFLAGVVFILLVMLLWEFLRRKKR